MVDKQMEEVWNDHRCDVLAQALGISAQDVRQWVIDDYPDKGADGMVYGHTVELSDEAPIALIERLGGKLVKVGPLSFKEGLEGA